MYIACGWNFVALLTNYCVCILRMWMHSIHLIQPCIAIPHTLHKHMHTDCGVSSLVRSWCLEALHTNSNPKLLISEDTCLHFQSSSTSHKQTFGLNKKQFLLCFVLYSTFNLLELQVSVAIQVKTAYSQWVWKILFTVEKMQPLHPLHKRLISIYSMLKIFRAFKFFCDTSLMTVNFPELCVVVCMYVYMYDNICIVFISMNELIYICTSHTYCITSCVVPLFDVHVVVFLH